MATTTSHKVLIESFWAQEGMALRVKQAALVIAGILFLTLAAKIKVPVWPSPVPITLGTFAVLTIGAAYGPRLGLTTILGYMIIGALGFDIFAGNAAGELGLTYMMGGTGGYLVGYVMATLALGWVARQGYDRSVTGMAGGLLLGNALIYIPGLLWLAVLYGFDKPILQWGLTPFITGDIIKLALAALLVPALWKLVGKARG